MQSGYRCDAGAQRAAHRGLVLRTHAGLLLLPQHSRHSIPLHSCAAVWNHMCHLCHLGAHHLPSDCAWWDCRQKQAGLSCESHACIMRRQLRNRPAVSSSCLDLMCITQQGNAASLWHKDIHWMCTECIVLQMCQLSVWSTRQGWFLSLVLICSSNEAYDLCIKHWHCIRMWIDSPNAKKKSLLPCVVLSSGLQVNFDAPCRTTNYPREIPELPWYRHTPAQMVMAGWFRFSSTTRKLTS